MLNDNLRKSSAPKVKASAIAKVLSSDHARRLIIKHRTSKS